MVLRYHSKATSYFSQLVENPVGRLVLYLWIVFITVEENIFKLSRSYWFYAFCVLLWFIFLLVLILHCYNLICYKNLGCLKIKPGVICPYCHKCSLSRCVNDCALFLLWKFKNAGILKYMYYCHSLVLLLWIAFVFTHVRKCG